MDRKHSKINHETEVKTETETLSASRSTTFVSQSDEVPLAVKLETELSCDSLPTFTCCKDSRSSISGLFIVETDSSLVENTPATNKA
ncbi:hypothetical protein Hanom_Chr06g00499841 [Helianthus anomalus]